MAQVLPSEECGDRTDPVDRGIPREGDFCCAEVIIGESGEGGAYRGLVLLSDEMSERVIADGRVSVGREYQQRPGCSIDTCETFDGLAAQSGAARGVQCDVCECFSYRWRVISRFSEKAEYMAGDVIVFCSTQEAR